MTDGQNISSDNPNKYFTMVENIALIELKPYELVLYTHYKRTCGQGGVTFKSNKTLSEETGLSVNTMKAARNGLIDKGYIRVTYKADENGNINTPPNVFIVDLMPRNVAYFESLKTLSADDTPLSADDTPLSADDTPLSADDTKEELFKKNPKEDITLTPKGVDEPFLVSKSGTVHSNNKGEPLCGTSAKQLTPSNEGEVSCKSCRKKLGLDESPRDLVMDWIAYHILDIHDMDSVNNWSYISSLKAQFKKVHDAFGTVCEPKYLNAWKDWYQGDKYDVHFSLPRNKDKLYFSYLEFYQYKKSLNGYSNPHPTPDNNSDDTPTDYVMPDEPPSAKAMNHG